MIALLQTYPAEHAVSLMDSVSIRVSPGDEGQVLGVVTVDDLFNEGGDRR